MYVYDEMDQAIVDQRVEQFRGQVARRLRGELTEEEFRPLRLMNGLYLQLHAYMLRVAVPYGVLSSTQMRKLAHIARRYDKGYGHFTTRQNIQFNWPKLEDTPDILAELSDVQMHAIQTSGNCIRNVTADQYAGVAADEIEDPRIYSEIIRQWSTLHPEFSFLPRKFKIAVTGAPRDRAALRVHDIGLRLCHNEEGEIGFEVMAGGGQGRTPMIAKTIRPFLARRDLLSYLEALMRVYNLFGRRDNKYKARIKILVHDVGAETFARMVEEEWQHLRDGELDLPFAELQRVRRFFRPPAYEDLDDPVSWYELKKSENAAFARWAATNVAAHKQPGYAIANISLKPEGGVPGDATAEQMDAIADLADRYSIGEIRVTHEQNLVLPHLKKADLFDLWRALGPLGLATPNVGTVTDIISCPGLDFCALATARSIPIAQQISTRFADIERQAEIGPLRIKISGCINACGHHHVGHIGILGLEKKGDERYQVTLGGRADENAALGEIVGPSFSAEGVVDAVETIVATYLDLREDGEAFIDAFERVGLDPFKDRLYGSR